MQLWFRKFSDVRLNFSNSGDFWIGGREYKVEGAWRWEYPTKTWNYTNWAPEKPSDQGNLDCLILSAENDYQWVDEDCESLFRPICQLLL